MKKFLSLVLALVMALSLTTVAWGAVTVTDTAGLTTEIKNGATEIALADGNYVMPDSLNGAAVNLQGKTLTIKGSRGAVIDVSKISANDQFVTGATLKFEGVTLNFGNVNYMGFANTASLTYEECAINGLQFLYGTSVTFKNCDLNSNGAEHCVWTYGAQNVTFTGCNFTYGDRGINVYSDNDIPGGKQTVNFEDCTFTTSNTNSKGAVEINSSNFSAGADVELNDCTAPANGEMAYVSQWDSTGGAKTDVFVDDALVGGVAKIGTAQYKSLQAAIDAAEDANTVAIVIDLLDDATLDVTAWETLAIGSDVTTSITINGNNNTLTFNQLNSDWNNIATKNGAKLIINNAKITNSGHNDGPWNRHDLNFACDVELNDVTSDKALAFKAGATLNNVTISDANTSDTYAIWIQPKGQDIVINGLVIDMIACSDGRGIKIDNQYINAADEGQVTLDIKNATFKTEEKAAILVKSTKGADITASNCNISKVAADSTNLVWVDEAVAAYANLVSVTGATGLVEGTAGVAQLNNIKYGKLADAVAAAAPAGDTITLLADCDETVTVGKELTFDFNGTNFTGFITPAAGYTYMDGVVKKTPAASGTTSTGTVTTGTVTPVKAKLYRLAAVGGSMIDTNTKVEKIELTTVTGKLVNDVPVYVPDIYKINSTYYVEVAKAHATYALKNNGVYTYLAPAGTASNVDAVIAKFATAVVLDQYVAAAEDVECGDAVKGTKGAAIYMSGTDAYYANGSNWAVFNGEFVKYNKNAKVAYKEHKWDATSIIVKSTDVKGTKVPVTIECKDCEKTFSIVPTAKFDNTWVKGVNYTTDKAVDKYNTAAVKYYIVLNNATYTGGTYVPSTDKVTSADTFDAGIAMYVGMSVMAAAGSAVVIGKKKD